MEGLIGKLAEQGIAYLLLALSILANVRLFFLLLEEKDKQIKKAEETTTKVTEPIEGLQTTLNGITLILQSIVKRK